MDAPPACTLRNAFTAISTLLFLLFFASGPAQSQFVRVTIDANEPRNPHCKTIGDIDGDGYIDVLAASSSNFTEGLFWYRYPTWQKINIHTGSFTTDMQVGDVDGDGDLDAIIPKGKDKGSSVWWYENPRPSGNPAQGPWREHFVGDAPAHDVEVADLNKDGRLDIVVRETQLTVFFQNTPTSWTKVIMNSRPVEGTNLADLDRDGDLDIILNGIWLENPLPGGNPRTAGWTSRTYATNWPSQVGVHVADLNRDGRPEILIAPSETATGRLSWYESANPRTGPWTEHVIDSDVSYVHTFKTGDMDRDGTLDIITSEMHQAPAPQEVSIYYNTNGTGLSWRQQIVATTGSHNIRVGDIGRDGDLDIVGANHNGAAANGAPIEMWENRPTSTTTKLPLDRWQRYVIDASRPWRSLLITAGDLNGDGRKDIVTGGWWYRNPGTAGGTWQRNTLGSPLNNMAAVADFDGNGSLDVVGTQGVGDASNASLAWARNNGSGGFTVLQNIPQANGTFLQGAASARFQGGALGVGLSWHQSSQGTQMLTVPSNPSTTSWSWRSISGTSQNEDLDAGDIDRDGDQDLLMGTKWLENSGTGWIARTLNGITVPVDRSRLVDMNKDGRLDAVVGFETTSLPGRVAWYEQPSSGATGTWAEHVITTNIIGAQSLDAGDLDRDGDPDVIVGEHNLSNPSASRLFIFENTGGNGLSWAARVVYTGDEHHDGAQLADIDNDGDLDIISIGWTHSRVLLYENRAIVNTGGEPPPPPPPPAGGTNVVSNGTFETSTAGWTFYTNGSGSISTIAPGAAGTAAALQLTVNSPGTNVQLYQQGITLQPNTSYQLSFDAYSSSAHDLEVSVQKHGSPYTNYGLAARKFDLSGGWQRHTVTFTTRNFSTAVSDARLMFWLAPYDAAGDRYYIDNVVLSGGGGGSGSTAPVITTQPANRSVVVGQTATFSVSATGATPLNYQWQKNGSNIAGATGASYTTPATALTDNGAVYRVIVTNSIGSATSSNATLSVTTTSTGGTSVVNNGTFETSTSGWTFYTNGAGAVAATIPGVSGSSRAAQITITTAGTNVQLYQAGIRLDPAASYTLSFDAYSTTGHDVDVSVQKHGSPYTNYGLPARKFDLANAWSRHTVTFTTANFSSAVADARLMFWMAPYDAAGDRYYIDNVVLARAGGGSATTNGIAGVEAEASTAVLLPEEFSLEKNFPNPFNPSTTIRYALPEPAVISLKIYSMLGQEVFHLESGQKHAGFHEVVWKGMNHQGHPVSSGMFLVRMVATGASGKVFQSVLRMLLVK